ncbi:ankyrin repeat-containing domain protein [Xylaria cf. heliscus]|nr:ankyrin repeat-containing domain protein [Xylaria cf. heliscus]
MSIGQTWLWRVQNLLRELYATSYKDQKDRNPERVPGTCEWFIHHDRFIHWRDERTSSLLWVSADPGCGKSVLVKYLVDEVFPSTRTSTTCYFFFKDDLEDQKTIENALRCILRQLLNQRKDLLSDELVEKFEADGVAISKSFSELWHLLMIVVKHKDAGKVICLLDAFDECTEEGRVKLSRELNKLYKTESTAFTLKFLITSRPYASIQREFQILESHKPTIHLQGENQTESDKISVEIDLVIKYKVETLSSELKLQSDEATKLYRRFTSIPHRTYLWVYLAFNSIRGYNGPVSFTLEDTTHDLPRTVADAYERILAKGGNETEARRLLHIVLAASRPLALHEMALALGLRDDVATYRDIRVEPIDRFRATVKALCGLFVIIVDSKIYLLHQTAREFLLGKQLDNHDFQWGGSFCLQESNYILATICVRYLHLIIDDLSENTYHGILYYAAQNWTLHFREALEKIDTELERSALQLCDPSSPLCISWVNRYRETKFSEFPKDPTALILASFFGLYNLVALILPQGADNLRVQDTQYGRTALVWASRNRNERVVQLLLKGLSRTGEIIKHSLLRRNTVIYSKDEDGRTALMHATIHGDYGISNMLIKKGASVTSRDKYGQTPISLATYYGHKETVELLHTHGAKLEPQNKYMQLKSREGYTLLSRAITQGQEDILQMLLDMNADIEAPSKDGSIPLYNAAETGNTGVAQLLLDNGASIEAADTKGRRALYGAAHMGHTDVVRLYGHTALHRAAWEGRTDVVRLLLESGANIKAKDKWDNTPLRSAGSHWEVQQMLLQAASRQSSID